MPPAHTSDERQRTSGGAKAPQPPADDADDAVWVEQCLAGEAEAFERLFLKHRQRLYSVAWRLMRNEDAALDIVQEAFVKAYERLGELRGGGRFFPWVRKIAVHQAIDRLRHQRRGVEVAYGESRVGEGEEADEYRSTAHKDEKALRENPVQQAELSEFSRDLQGALEKLSEAHRTVFMLHAAEGMTYKEIAESLGCNIGTVMSRLFYARQKLQELLASHLDREEK